MTIYKRLLVAFLVALGLLGCSESDDVNALRNVSKDVMTYKVQENYGVGDNVYVRALKYESEKNTIWVGTTVGVHAIDQNTKEVINTFTRDDGLANEYVFAVGVDAEGYKWFGTNAGGVSRYREGEWQVFFPMHGLADYWIYSFASQKNGDLWIGTWAGVNKYEIKSKKLTTYVKELVNEWVYGIDVDSQDRVWFGTEGGVSMFDGNDWKSWTHKDGVGAKNVYGYEASINTGLGTRQRHDLGVLRGGQPTYNPNYVFTLSVDENDQVWIGTWGGGVSVYDGKEWRSYTVRDGLAGNIVYSSARDGKGGMWFGTSGGLSHFDGEKWQNITMQHGLLGNNVYAVEVDSAGEVWAGTRNGVTRIVKQ